jgi:acyl dehydratase
MIRVLNDSMIFSCSQTVGTYLGGVANGVPFDKTISTGIQRSIADPGSHHPPLPQWTVTEPTIKTQSDFYRLNGDYNPLHIDPAIGKELGYGGLIMHGLLVYAIAVRAILTNFANNDTTALKSVFANFSGPVTPGDSVVVKVWKLGPGPAGTGTTELAFEAHARSTGTLALGQGVALVVISEDPSVIPQPGQDVDAGVGTVTQAMNPVVASGAWLVSFFSSPIHKLLAWFAR